MRILRPIRRLPRHPNAATSHAPMHRLSSPWRPPISFMASTVPRWWSPLPTRRVSPLMGPLTPPVRRVSRFPWEPRYMTTISRVKGNESDKPSMRQPVSSANVIIPSQDNKNSAIIQGMKIVDTRDTISDVTARDEKSDKDACRATSEVLCVNYNISGQIMKHSGFCEEDRRSEMEEQRGGVVVSDDKEVTDDEDCSMDIVLPKGRHRDGSIYRGIMDTWWKREYLIADRNETRLEAMRFSNPSNCIEDDGTCWQHFPRSMLQILSLELAKIHNDGGLVELYGYIAVRDDVDPLLNYIVNFSRDDPIIVEQGSVINMMGPKRGIELMDSALIEYDMRIKTGEQEKDDLQLIDGASIICPPGLWNEPFSIDIPGDYGAVDITVAHLHSAVEATVEVVISEVQSGFNLLLGCLTSDVNKEMRLFDGAIVESRFLKRSVVAVLMESSLDLKFKVGASPSSFDQHCVSFKAKIHGHDTQEIKTDFALISVKNNLVIFKSDQFNCLRNSQLPSEYFERDYQGIEWAAAVIASTQSQGHPSKQFLQH